MRLNRDRGLRVGLAMTAILSLANAAVQSDHVAAFVETALVCLVCVGLALLAGAAIVRFRRA